MKRLIRWTTTGATGSFTRRQAIRKAKKVVDKTNNISVVKKVKK